MLKKITIALVMSGWTFAAHAEDAVTLYGILDVGVASTTNVKNAAGPGTVYGMQAGAMHTPRWGIKGSEDMGDGTHANFVLESELLPQTGNTLGAVIPGSGTIQLFKRGAWLGVSQDNIGEIRLGRQDTISYDYVAKYDAMRCGNVGALAILGTGTNSAINPYGVDRYNNSVQLRSADIGGLKLRAGYAFGNQVDASTNGNIYDLGAEYTYDKLRIAAVHLTENGGGASGVSTNANQALTNYGIFAMYDADFARFNIGHTSTSLSGTAGAFVIDVIGARIPVAEKTTLIAQYAEVSDGTTGTSPNEISGGVQYDFSHHTSVYALFSYAQQDGNSELTSASTSKFNNADGTGVTPELGMNQTTVMVGMDIRF